MLNLYYSYNVDVENAYIITIKDDKDSNFFSKRCQDSCKKVDMPYKIWDAYNGKSDKIIEPENLKNESIMSILKITDHYLTRGEVACALSHISLWNHCAKIDKPIVILEHDSIVVKKFTHLESFNSIVYLGGNEWVEQNWKIHHMHQRVPIIISFVEPMHMQLILQWLKIYYHML